MIKRSDVAWRLQGMKGGGGRRGWVEGGEGRKRRMGSKTRRVSGVGLGEAEGEVWRSGRDGV